MLPSSTDSQFVLSSSLDIEPSTSVNQYVDYFGTRVAAFDVLSPHAALHDLGALARRGASAPARARRHHVGRPGTPRRSARSRRSSSSARRRAPSRTPRSPRSPARSRRSTTSPGVAAHEISMAIGDAVEYMHGITGVHSTAARGVGGAQGRLPGHRAHHARRAARGRHPGAVRLGLPAPAAGRRGRRSRSPASRTRGSSGSPGEWQGFDPTNNIDIGDRHVLVGRGRDYNDVPPLRGVYAGPFKSQLHVKVTITREA